MKPLALSFLAFALLAQQPKVTNGRMETRAVSTLGKDFQSIVTTTTGATWVGYAVAKTPGSGNQCRQPESSPVHLEGSPFGVVLYRIEHKTVQKVRISALECDFDAGGLPFVWLTGVKPAESLALLQTLVPQHAEGALAAIALHAGAGADRLLEEYAAAGRPTDLREKAVFWMGAARGRRGYETLARIVRADKDEKVREKAVFALFVSKEPAAADSIVRAAKEDASAHVRGQALFWLAQKAGAKAVGAISDAIANDPETDVKKKAVFALSQLPKEQGVPLLIEVARNNRNPAVKKQAFFWLGQSKDARALAYLENVLTR
ncbi:MAG: HEAT repeat domain-containing protein [Bryobacterales bacterium]|nr:HEAT repeat domain-containing protein [Bryobacterales bacterium]